MLGSWSLIGFNIDVVVSDVNICSFVSSWGRKKITQLCFIYLFLLVVVVDNVVVVVVVVVDNVVDIKLFDRLWLSMIFDFDRSELEVKINIAPNFDDCFSL